MVKFMYWCSSIPFHFPRLSSSVDASNSDLIAARAWLDSVGPVFIERSLWLAFLSWIHCRTKQSRNRKRRSWRFTKHRLLRVHLGSWSWFRQQPTKRRLVWPAPTGTSTTIGYLLFAKYVRHPKQFFRLHTLDYIIVFEISCILSPELFSYFCTIIWCTYDETKIAGQTRQTLIWKKSCEIKVLTYIVLNYNYVFNCIRYVSATGGRGSCC